MTDDDPGRPRLRRALSHAVLAGLTPLIPVPFLDDRVLRWVREGMVRSLAADHGLPLSDAALEILAGARDPGALSSFFTTMVLWPLKKLFRKIFFFLSVKECGDLASATLHEGYLLQHAAVSGRLSAVLAGGPAGEAEAWRIRGAILAACRGTDTGAVEQLVQRGFDGSSVLLGEASRRVAPLARRLLPRGSSPAAQATISVEETEALRPLVDRLVEAVWEQRGSLGALQARFDEALALPALPPPAAPDTPSATPDTPPAAPDAPAP